MSQPVVYRLPRSKTCFVIALAGLLVAGSPGWGQETKSGDPPDSAPFTDQQIEFFESKVRPLLVEHCYECHGPDVDPVEGGLGLTSRQSLLEGGDSGPAIDLGNPDQSILLSAVEYGDLFQMPPDSRLPDDDLEILRTWIRGGAAWPDEDAAAVNRGEEFDLIGRRDSHWCWKPVRRQPVPQTGGDWALDPLDEFILQKLHDEGLTPAPAADRRTWLRRVTLDLTGLPPTPAEIDRFLQDDSDQAWQRVVDQLLASPRFGERWARHWMDLIRYAETCGHEFDYPIPHAWQYRDYLIRAFNADVPYDDFVVEHIAGDMLNLPRRNPDNQINESVLGTGFWFLGEATHGPVDVKGDEAGRIDNQIDVMSKTFLGLTVACARCHDHKFDAISAADYYAMSGFLQSSRRQDVMLDPGQKMETAWNEAQAVSQRANDQIKDLVLGPILQREIVPDEMAPFIETAVRFLRLHRDWMAPTEIRIEGETLVDRAEGPGKVSRQNINGWSAGAQLWWTEARPDDTLKISFAVSHAARWDLAVDFTTAADYGIVDIILNGDVVTQRLDLYSDGVKRTGEQGLGTFELEPGPNQLELRLVGKNEKAIEGYMAGIDYLVLRREDDGQSDMASLADLEHLAEESELDPALLKNWVLAIADQATRSVTHPFWLLRQTVETTIDLESDEADEFIADQIRQLMHLDRDYFDGQNDFPEFETRVRDWDRTGFAFGGIQGFGLDASDPKTPFPAICIHSGRNGTRFQGALRSPTFEITSSRINYLVKARDAKIRIIIDGFRLDTYNPLLFADASIDVDTDGQWKWISQSGDLKNYLGHRAFIEVIDPGDGYIALADVRLSNNPPPEIVQPFQPSFLPQPERWRAMRLSGGLSSLELLSHSIAQNFERVLKFGFGYGNYINYFYRHQLIPGLNYDESNQAISDSLAAFERINQTVPAPVLAIGMTEGTPENEYVFIRGNHKNLGDLAPRAPLAALREGQWQFDPATSGRMELARHIVSPDNPLTRRVLVNRIWHHLNGRGLVASVDNFGVLGTVPSHPELLDYLASEFADQDWSIKSLIRRIVLSQTYRMSAATDPAAIRIDPENQFLHSARVRRLPGEAIRDSILAISGELDATMYGPPVPIHLTPFMQGRGRPGESGPLDGNGRRSVYIEVRRNFLAPMMLAFDTPIPFNTIGRRNQSNVPAQALILLNDPFVLEQAQKWARHLVADEPDPNQRIRRMYESALGRRPTADELDHATRFIESQMKLLASDADESAREIQAWADLCHVMFNLKEFIYIQ